MYIVDRHGHLAIVVPLSESTGAGTLYTLLSSGLPCGAAGPTVNVAVYRQRRHKGDATRIETAHAQWELMGSDNVLASNVRAVMSPPATPLGVGELVHPNVDALSHPPAKVCPDCEGERFFLSPPDGTEGFVHRACETCNATGEVPA